MVGRSITFCEGLVILRSMSQKERWAFSLSLILFVLSIVSFLGQKIWLFELVSHFCLQLAVVAFSIFMKSVFWRIERKSTYILLLLSFALNSGRMVPSFTAMEALRPKSSSLTVLSFNLNRANRERRQVRDYISGVQADFVILAELSTEWSEALQGLYPYEVLLPRYDNFGMAILSKHKILQKKVLREPKGVGAPALVVDVEVNNQSLRLAAVHPTPPIVPQWKRLRDQYFDRLIEFLKQEDMPTIVCGDFNSTPWASVYKSWLERLQYRAAQGSWLSTWPAPYPYIGFSLDHCIVSKDLQFGSYKQGPHKGSDHFPLEVSFSIKSLTEPQ